jgi:hypothetical protein
MGAHNGQRTTDNGLKEHSDVWRFRGSPPYLDQQARRLGIAQTLADRARHNPEIYRLAVLLAQLSERYHQQRKEDGKPVFGRIELAQIEGTLGQCELELQKLHMLAAASSAMLAEAYAAFELLPSSRRYGVVCRDDEPLYLPIGDGAIVAALSESG